MAIIIPRPRIKPRLGARLDRQHPLSSGLVGCWLFNEGGGNKLWDISGNLNHGTLTNMDPSSDWVSDPGGIALDFDGINDYVSVPQKSIFQLSSSAFTVVVCLLDDTPAASLSTYHRAVSWYDGSKNIQLGIGSNLGSRVVYVLNSSSTAFPQSISSSLSTGMHHIVATFDGSSNYNIYVDGKLFSVGGGSTQAGVFTANSTTLYIGQRGDGAGYVVGKILGVSIYKRVLSNSEISWLNIEPYANVVQPVYRRYFIQSGATFQPAWAMRSSHVIGVSNA